MAKNDFGQSDFRSFNKGIYFSRINEWVNLFFFVLLQVQKIRLYLKYLVWIWSKNVCGHAHG